MAEAVIAVPPLVSGVSGLELAAAFGADLITLNMFNFNAPFIFGVDDIDLHITLGPVVFDKIKRRMEKNREDAD